MIGSPISVKVCEATLHCSTCSVWNAYGSSAPFILYCTPCVGDGRQRWREREVARRLDDRLAAQRAGLQRGVQDGDRRLTDGPTRLGDAWIAAQTCGVVCLEKGLDAGVVGVLRVVRIDEVVRGVDAIGSGPGEAEEQLRRAGVGDEHRRRPSRVLCLGVGQLGEERRALQPERNRDDRVGQLAGNAADLGDGLVVDVGLDRLLVDDLEPELDQPAS